MTFFKDADSNERDEFYRSINQRWGQLHSSEKEWTDNIIKYLFAINTGGAVTVLAYLGAVQGDEVKVAIGCGIKLSLYLFVFGIFLVGLITARMFYVFEGLYVQWRSNTKLFLNNEIDWSKLHDDDDKRSENHCIDYILPWAAFGVWIAGVIVGLIDFW